MTLQEIIAQIATKFDELGFSPTTLMPPEEQKEHFVEWFADEIRLLEEHEKHEKSVEENYQNIIYGKELINQAYKATVGLIGQDKDDLIHKVNSLRKELWETENRVATEILTELMKEIEQLRLDEEYEENGKWLMSSTVLCAEVTAPYGLLDQQGRKYGVALYPEINERKD